MQSVLKSLGLTGKEAELFLFLAKNNALRSGEIAKGIHTHRVEVYRMLKSLQKKGTVEATLEAPTRFTAVPLETVLDSFIKAKREETAAMESTKQSVLNEWKHISKTESQLSLEKFVVIEGERKIYSKIAQMIRETKNQLSIIISVPGLERANQFGVLDAAFSHPLKNKVKLRFLTEFSNENVKTVKAFLKNIPKRGFDFKGRNPDLGLKLSPQMALRDKEELLFFIRPTIETPATTQEDVCLWTNCKGLVQSFSAIFEDLWRNSTDIQTKIGEVEAGVQTKPKTCIISDSETAHEKYGKALQIAEKEIIMITSEKGPAEIWKNKHLLNEWARKQISVKIMAPITSENKEIVQELSEHHEVRHVPLGYLSTTIVDGKDLFQFNTPLSVQKTNSRSTFEGTICSNDLEYVTRTKNMLTDIWKNARPPSGLPSGVNALPPMPVAPLPDNDDPWLRPNSAYQKMIVNVMGKKEAVTDRDVLSKIINAKKVPRKNWPKDILRFYGSTGNAVIHPPANFNLPDLVVRAAHENKQSSFGATDRLYVYLWLETQTGYAYVPVASVSDNPKDADFQKTLFAGTPAGQNIQIFKKDELQLRFHGTTFFAGWTKPIPLIPTKYTLPPACILLEGYSKLKTNSIEFTYPSGVKVNVEANGYDAFVTFFHPKSKYSGPGTDGVIGRDVVATINPSL